MKNVYFTLFSVFNFLLLTRVYATENPDFKIYPNPASQSISVNLITTDSCTYTFSLFNILGEKMISYSKDMDGTSNKTVTINTAAVPNGIYFLIVDNGTEAKKEKVIIRH